jgi:3-(3-hydroxy-phenyl)propionate hydroxylase
MTIDVKKHYDVVISGAGPCGSTLANLLGQQGVSVLLIDKEADIVNIPRAVGMCDEGYRILNTLDIFDHAPADFIEVSRTNFSNHNAETVFHVDMAKENNNLPVQQTFYQPQLEKCIRESFSRFESLDFSPISELIDFNDNGQQVDITLKVNGIEESISSRFLVGCDGARSPIRKKLGIGFSGKTYLQDWLIIDIGKNPVESDEIFFSIDSKRPGVTLPLPHNKRRWEFVVKEDDDKDVLFSDAFLSELLSPWGDFKDMELERKAIYTFHARSASNYSKGNVFIAGDAAHITPPFAGQGMMAGFRDAQNLSWKLAGVLNKSLHPNLLNSYDTERRNQAKQVIRFAEHVGRIVLPQSRIKAMARDSFIRLMTLTGLYSKDKGADLAKVKNHINGHLISHLFSSKLYGTGTWFPQHTLTKNQITKPSDHWLSNDFHIIGWNHNGLSALSEKNRKKWQIIGGKNISISDTHNGEHFVDTSNEYANLFCDKNTIVIRPDKMMVIKCHRTDLDKYLTEYLDTICPEDSQAA